MLSFIAARMKLIVNTVAIPRPTRSEPSRSSIQKLTQERITTQMQGMYIWKMKYTDRRWNLMVVVRPEKVSGEEAETQWEVCSVLTLCHTLHRVVAVQLDRRRGVMNALVKALFTVACVLRARKVGFGFPLRAPASVRNVLLRNFHSQDW